jgi:hypothetical protein
VLDGKSVLDLVNPALEVDVGEEDIDIDDDWLGDPEELGESLALSVFVVVSPLEKDSVFDVRTERVRAPVFVPPLEDEIVALRDKDEDRVTVPETDAVFDRVSKGDIEIVREPLDVKESCAEDEEETDMLIVKVDAPDVEALAHADIEAVCELFQEAVIIGDTVLSIVFDFVPTPNDCVKVGGKDCVAVELRDIRDVAVAV